ncbi:MAG: LytR C-terminal domain-containing protein [Bacteroidota bacterium]
MRRGRLRILLLNAAIGVLALLVLYLGYSLLHRHVLSPPVEPVSEEPGPVKIIQIDVLNGCGTRGAGAKVMTYLRKRGFDVVEVRNYKTSDVDRSLVIDRAGDLETARQVAYALGITEANVIQQINPDYFVDVSVVVGRDYKTLKSSR